MLKDLEKSCVSSTDLERGILQYVPDAPGARHFQSFVHCLPSVVVKRYQQYTSTTEHKALDLQSHETAKNIRGIKE